MYYFCPKLILTLMKRCNNCGWFNLDSAVQCEKCGEKSFKSAIVEGSKVEEQHDVVEDSELKEIKEDKPAENQEVNRSRNSMASTVMVGVGGGLHGDNDFHCPKCRYPIVGDVDYCPNCGTTVRINAEETHINSLGDEPELSVKIQGASVKSFDPKATVRDFPEELISVHKVNDNVFKLVPVDNTGANSIVLELDQIVVLEGRRYRFCK